MQINHNITAMNTLRQLNINSNAQAKSMAKLSSGLRINSAADDAAGLSISEKMKGQIRGLDQASRNAQDGISLTQTAEGALGETTDILQRMRELSTQAANGTATDQDRSAMQDEFNQLTSEINRIGNTTEFNTQKLLNGGIGTNSGDKITQATSADKTLTATMSTGAAQVGAVKITVDNQTFDLTGIQLGASGSTATLATADYDKFVADLGNVTSGGVKLSDVVDIKDVNGKLEFTDKSNGSTSTISFTASTNDSALGLTAASDAGITFSGDPTLEERTGLQAGSALTSSVTIGSTDSLKFTVGTDSPVTVNLNSTGASKTYDIGNTDDNVAAAARQDLVKDLNAALQTAGLSDKVTASLSKDNEIQFISQTGKDISVTNGTNTPLTSSLGFSGSETVGNVEQVIGAGAQGVGFTTKFQIGANTGQSMSLTINDMRAAALGLTGNAGQQGFTAANSVTNGTDDIKSEAALNISSVDSASKTISVIDNAIQSVSSERSKLGAVQNRLEHTINNLNTSSQNITDAQSRITDVDMAAEMMNQTKSSVLAQAAQAMLAQANQQPQQVLQLLR